MGFLNHLVTGADVKSQIPDNMLQQIERSGVVSVLIIENVADAVPLAKALLAGGVNAMELTLRTDAAIEGLRQIREHVPEMLAGIGTVLNTDQVDEVVRAGAQFAVSPGLNRDVVRKAQDAGLPFAPGVMTPTDIEAALDLGCRELKFFPAVPGGGLPMLNSIRAPYAHLGVRFIPLGGVKAQNMTDWLSNPGVFAVGGSWLTPKSAVAEGKWEVVTELATQARSLADSLTS